MWVHWSSSGVLVNFYETLTLLHMVKDGDLDISLAGIKLLEPAVSKCYRRRPGGGAGQRIRYLQGQNEGQCRLLKGKFCLNERKNMSQAS